MTANDYVEGVCSFCVFCCLCLEVSVCLFWGDSFPFTLSLSPLDSFLFFLLRLGLRMKGLDMFGYLAFLWAATWSYFDFTKLAYGPVGILW